MHKLTFRLRTLFSAVVLAGAAALPAAAQTMVQAQQYEPASALTYRTSNPELAVDASLATAATLQPSLLAGRAALHVNFPTVIQSGQQAVLYLKADAGILDLSALGRISVRTFLSANSVSQAVQQTVLDDGAVSVSLLPDNSTISKVTLAVGQKFDHLEISTGAVLNVSSNVYVYAVFASVSPLPVQLTTFQGQATTNGAVLKWETASERNADYFEVQRAESPAGPFSSLGQVKSAGSAAAAHAYEFVDERAVGLHYYRLRLVDRDGTARFSPVATVAGGQLARLMAYPTVAATVLHVAGQAGTQLHVLNAQGQRVQTVALVATQPQPLDVSTLPSGTYFLRDAATGQSARFIKSGGH